MVEWIKLDTRTVTINPTEKEYFTVVEASSFGELKEVMPQLEIPKGERIRFVMELNMPVALAFNLPGAELIFRRVMPEGLELIDVRAEGMTTVIIEAESDPVWLVAVGVFLLANWKFLALAAIGITVALGLLIMSIRVDVTKAVEAIPETAKWIAIGLGTAAALGLVIAYTKKRRG